jgi:hypothetical protein
VAGAGPRAPRARATGFGLIDHHGNLRAQRFAGRDCGGVARDCEIGTAVTVEIGGCERFRLTGRRKIACLPEVPLSVTAQEKDAAGDESDGGNV